MQNSESEVRQLDWEELTELWENIKKGETPNWNAGKALEYLILRAFQLCQADVTFPYTVKLEHVNINEEIDGLIYYNGLSCMIECKDHSDKINFEPVAKLRSQLMRRPSSTIGSIFSRSNFSLPTIVLSHFIAPQTILLWTADDIDDAIEKRNIGEALIQKYRHCIEHGNPYFDLKVV